MAEEKKSEGKAPERQPAAAGRGISMDPTLAKYHAMFAAQEDKQVLEKSLLISLCVFIVLTFVVFPEFVATLAGLEEEEDVIDVQRQTIVQQEEPPPEQERQLETQQREREFSQVPDIARPTGDIEIIEDIADLNLDVHSEFTDDLMFGPPPDSTPGPIEVAGDIIPPQYDCRGPQPYPQRARILRRTGRVRIRVVISREGALETIDILSEDPPGFGFGEAAVQYLRQCSWTAAIQNGRPIYARYSFIFQFQLTR